MADGRFVVNARSVGAEGHGVDVVVTQDSGGALTWAKMAVADQLGVPVVMVRRPGVPPGVAVAASAADAAARLEFLL